jgi:hypothetical protein
MGSISIVEKDPAAASPAAIRRRRWGPGALIPGNCFVRLLFPPIPSPFFKRRTNLYAPNNDVMDLGAEIKGCDKILSNTPSLTPSCSTRIKFFIIVTEQKYGKVGITVETVF